MSFADFDEIFEICCGWDKVGLYRDETMLGKNKIFANPIEQKPVDHANHWWKAAEKEIYEERQKELIYH